MSEMQWQVITRTEPPDGEVVWTKIDDPQGVRNEQTLKRRGRLWFFPDASMYVYYTPTHYAPYTPIGSRLGEKGREE